MFPYSIAVKGRAEPFPSPSASSLTVSDRRPGIQPCFPHGKFPRSSHTTDLKKQQQQQKFKEERNTRVTLVATLPDLWEQAGQEPVAKQILQRKWGWIGHTIRKPASGTTRQALKRKRGRPRNSWRRDTEAELKQQGTNWTGMARAAQNMLTECDGEGL